MGRHIFKDSEEYLEKWAVKYARENHQFLNYKADKSAHINGNGWPDQIFFNRDKKPGGASAFLVEFKVGKGTLSKWQKKKIDDLRAFGLTVYVCISQEEFIQICNMESGRD